MAELVCVEGDVTEKVPMHCGQEMHIEAVDGVEMLVCWMGPGCGKKDIPTHHDKPMVIRG